MQYTELIQVYRFLNVKWKFLNVKDLSWVAEDLLQGLSETSKFNQILPPPHPQYSNLNNFLVAQGMFSLSICMTQSLGADESVLQLWTDLYIILNSGQFCS